MYLRISIQRYTSGESEVDLMSKVKEMKKKRLMLVADEKYKEKEREIK